MIDQPHSEIADIYGDIAVGGLADVIVDPISAGDPASIQVKKTKIDIIEVISPTDVVFN
ncbi:MAG: hypothetical protein P8N98_17550 [Paracoccaceae bacterium]|nr:hypothetical protein [Paracoccaceae bacterium]